MDFALLPPACLVSRMGGEMRMGHVAGCILSDFGATAWADIDLLRARLAFVAVASAHSFQTVPWPIFFADPAASGSLLR